MRMKYLLYVLVVAAGLTSCYRRIDLDDYRTTPKMVINSVVSPDTVVMATITRTWFYPDAPSDVCLPQARVELYVNGQYIERMSWKTVHHPDHPDLSYALFCSNTVPAEGDTVRIVASEPAYGEATAVDVIPKKVPIGHVAYTVRRSNGVYQGMEREYDEVDYEITFNEYPTPGNYYLLRITRERRYLDGTRLEAIEADYLDPVFKEQDAILDGSLSFDGLEKRGGALFTDRHINGQTYTLQVREVNTNLEDHELREISLYSLSESYFLYLLSLQRVAGSTLNGALGDIGLAEPLRVYSNVAGGTGILGGFQQAAVKIELRK